VALAADLASGDELGAFQDPQVLEDRRAVELRDVRCHLAGRPRAVPEEVEDAAAGGGSQRLEDEIVVGPVDLTR